MMIQGQRGFRDIPDLPSDASQDEIVKAVNDLISNISFLNKYLSLQSNFECQIIKVTFAAGETKAIPHKLGIVPQFRIILRSEGNGVLSDIPSGWNTFQIQMKNEGAVPVTATIMIVRE